MHIQPHNSLERIFAVTVLMCGMIVFSSTVSSITAATNSLKNLNATYDENLWSLRRFFREQHIPHDLVARVLRYAETKLKPRYQHLDHTQVAMLSELPQALYREVYWEIYRSILDVHPLFSNLSEHNPSLLQNICSAALQEHRLDKGELLFSPGQVCTCMYFVTEGTLSYFATGLVEGGSQDLGVRRYFCEAVLWTPWVHQGRMFARSEATLTVLQAKRFQEACLDFSGDFEMLRVYGEHFVYQMNDAAGNFTEEEDDDVDLSDLVVMDGAEELVERLLMNGGSF